MEAKVVLRNESIIITEARDVSWDNVTDIVELAVYEKVYSFQKLQIFISTSGIGKSYRVLIDDHSIVTDNITIDKFVKDCGFQDRKEFFALFNTSAIYTIIHLTSQVYVSSDYGLSPAQKLVSELIDKDNYSFTFKQPFRINRLDQVIQNVSLVISKSLTYLERGNMVLDIYGDRTWNAIIIVQTLEDEKAISSITLNPVTDQIDIQSILRHMLLGEKKNPHNIIANHNNNKSLDYEAAP